MAGGEYGMTKTMKLRLVTMAATAAWRTAPDTVWWIPKGPFFYRFTSFASETAICAIFANRITVNRGLPSAALDRQWTDSNSRPACWSAVELTARPSGEKTGWRMKLNRSCLPFCSIFGRIIRINPVELFCPVVIQNAVSAYRCTRRHRMELSRTDVCKIRSVILKVRTRCHRARNVCPLIESKEKKCWVETVTNTSFLNSKTEKWFT